MKMVDGYWLMVESRMLEACSKMWVGRFEVLGTKYENEGRREKFEDEKAKS